MSEFLSTLSLRRATHYDNYNLHCVEISIHALLAESDGRVNLFGFQRIISIHALLAESDRGWTLNINGSMKISIHALLAESDIVGTSQVFQRIAFLSTLSLRRATEQSASYNAYLEEFLSTLSLRRATLGRVEVV